MTIRPRKSLLYWFPIVLPLLTGVVVVGSNGIVEWVSFVTERVMLDKSNGLESKNVTVDTATAKEGIGLKSTVPRERLGASPEGVTASQQGTRIENGVDFKNGVGSEKGKDGWERNVTKDEKEEVIARTSGDVEDKDETIAEERKEELEEMSPVMTLIWREINEAVIVGIFAVYCHFLSFVIPSLAGQSGAANTHVAYILGLVGLFFHLSIILAVPSFHKMHTVSEGVEYLTWATVLVVASFVLIFIMHELVWRRIGRSERSESER